MRVAAGTAAAAAILALRANDGSGAVVPPPSGSGPGAWLPTPPAFAPYLLPQWGFVTPFAMTNSSQFRPPGPPALTSGEYAADYNEVKAFGAAVGSSRTPVQDVIAQFWADGVGTETLATFLAPGQRSAQLFDPLAELGTDVFTYHPEKYRERIEALYAESPSKAEVAA